MYWPFSTPTLLASSEGGQQVQSLAFSRTADLFLALSVTQLDLFNAKVRPSAQTVDKFLSAQDLT